jgi:hypothetical protein
MVYVPIHPTIPRPHTSRNHMYNSLPFFNSEFKFLLMHELNFHVTGLSYGSNTRDVMRRVPRSWAAFDVVATATSNWILVATAYRWILTATVSSRPSRSEFQHSSPPPPSGQGYWPPPWAPPAGGQAPPWRMPSWMTPTS